jgi:CRISPR-associated protein Csx10
MYMSDNPLDPLLGERFEIRLEMLSDWHVGTGTGIPGSVDSLLSKDSDGFPHIPSKTIVGIWRDVMERLAFGLDNGNQDGPWSRWVEVIFGIQPNLIDKDNLSKRLANNQKTYSRSILSLTPARISGALRETINSKHDVRLIQAVTFIKPEIKIKEVSGTSETNMLRFAEMGRVGTVLGSWCELNFDGLIFERDEAIATKQKETISALLIASANLIERIGGKRRRGSGKCKFEVVGSELSAAAIQLLDRDAPAPPLTVEVRRDGGFLAPVEGNEWQRMEYVLRLHTPISIVTATLGNVSESLDFIPGTYLLPYITKGTNLFAHVANGDFQISPATIEVNGTRGLPVPTALSAQKVGGGFDQKGTVVNRFKEKLTPATPQLKPYREGYISDLGDQGKLPLHMKASKTLLMHNTVEDQYQRPTAEVGGVYSRQAIATTWEKNGTQRSTILRGEIRFKKSVPVNLSTDPQQVRLGSSKKDDYGLATIAIKAIEEKTDSNQKKNEQTDLKKGQTLVVYFESDSIIRNGNLRLTNLVDDLKAEFAQTLGREKLRSFDEVVSEASSKLRADTTDSESKRIVDENDGLVHSLIQTRRIESWHEGWGLPRPSLIAIQAGSCVKFQATDTITAAELDLLEQSGIGERRGEGYGRIRFNPRILTEAISDWEIVHSDHDKKTEVRQIPIDSTLTSFTHQIEISAWRQEVHRAVMIVADKAQKREKLFGFVKGGKPSMSQIGSLRAIIMRLKKDGSNKHTVREWLTHLQQTRHRLEKWEGFGELKNLFEEGKEELLWQRLEWSAPPLLIEQRGELNFPKEELWVEAMQALFDACMRAHKRDGGSE